MTDRELLELAAKAAGVEVEAWDGDYPVCFFMHWSGDPNEEPQYEPIHWNPLTDDGDALRLAVKLKLRVIDGQAEWIDDTYCIETSDEADRYAATRRAIVRAAAEIQRSKKSETESATD